MNEIKSSNIAVPLTLTPVPREIPTRPIKVMFLYPNTLLTNRIPLALSVLSACLKQVGHETVLFDTTFMRIEEGESDEEARYNSLQVKEANLEEYGVDWEQVENVEQMFRQAIQDEKPDLIAATIVENTYPIALRLLNAVKDFGAPIVVGGVRATTEPETAISEDCIDILCMGEGEAALTELCNAIADGREYKDIPNLWVKQDGKIHKNPMRPLTDMETLPVQDWDMFDASHLYRPLGGEVYRMGNFEMSRGCPYKCQYCVEPGYAEIFEGLQPKSNLRQKSIDDVIDEIEHFVDTYNIDLAYFHDETFLAMPIKRFEEFCEKYVDRIDLPYAIQTTASTITEKTAKMLEDSGCINIAIGLETGNEKFRREVLMKNITNKQILNAFSILKRFPKIRATANNIIGLPYETREHIMETFQINRDADPDATNVNLFFPYKGSPLRNICLKEGYITGDEDPVGYRTGTILKMPQISSETLMALQKTFQFYIRFPSFALPAVRLLERSIAEDRIYANALFKLAVMFFKVWTRGRYG